MPRRIRHTMLNGCRVRRLPSGAMEVERELARALGPAAAKYVKRVCGCETVCGRDLIRVSCSPDRVQAVTRVLATLEGQREREAERAATVAAALAWEPTARQLRTALVAVEQRPGMTYAQLAAAVGVDIDQARVIAERLIAVGLVHDERRLA